MKGPVGLLQSLQLAGDAAGRLWPRERKRERDLAINSEDGKTKGM